VAGWLPTELYPRSAAAKEFGCEDGTSVVSLGGGARFVAIQLLVADRSSDARIAILSVRLPPGKSKRDSVFVHEAQHLLDLIGRQWRGAT